MFWRNFIATGIVWLLGQNRFVQNIVHVSLSLERVEEKSLEAAGTRDSEGSEFCSKVQQTRGIA